MHAIRWKQKCGGLLPLEVRRLRSLEEENARLRKLVADLTLDKEVVRRKMRRLLGAGEMVEHARGCFRVSMRRACRAAPAPQSTFHYRSRRPGQAVLRKRIREIAEARPSFAYLCIHVRCGGKAGR